MAKFEPGHCYDWILKKSGSNFFHDDYWVFEQLGYDWTIKQSGHDFPGKHLCDGYCMDIMCDAYMCKFKTFKIENSTECHLVL